MKVNHGLVESQGLSNVKDLVLILLKEGSEQEIVPTTVLGSGVYYVLAGFHVPADRLLAYHKEAFLEVRRHVSFPSCSVCRSTSLKLEVLCPNCREADLTRADLVVHYECGYMGSVEEFMGSGQGLIDKCPKCGKPLKRVGIDYGRPGLGFKCHRCGSIFQYPLANLKCDQGHSTTLDKINVERYPVFIVSKELWRARPIVELLQKIQTELKHNLDLDSEVLQVVRGKSGATHLVHVLVQSDGKLVAIEVFEEGAEVMEALSVVSKAVDLGIHFVVILSEEKAAELRKILHPGYFTIVPIRSLDFDELRDALVESVYSVVAEKTI